MHYIFLISFSYSFFSLAAQSPVEMPLYPNGLIPNSIPAENLEKTALNQDNILFTTQTSVPTLTLYRAENPNGTAVIICPGGGYFGTACDHEGAQVAQWLNTAGITAFVLKYRIPDARTCVEKRLAPLQDAQQAIRTVRKNAARWGINPQRVGILGFSAGGHLAALAATHFMEHADPAETDTTSLRPDFVALIYPVISAEPGMIGDWIWNQLLGTDAPPALRKWASCEQHVTGQTPPSFLVHTQNDDVVKFDHSMAYYQACMHEGVPVELQLYPEGGHGFGLNNPKTTDRWGERLLHWIESLN